MTFKYSNQESPLCDLKKQIKQQKLSEVKELIKIYYDTMKKYNLYDTSSIQKDPNLTPLDGKLTKLKKSYDKCHFYLDRKLCNISGLDSREKIDNFVNEVLDPVKSNNLQVSRELKELNNPYSTDRENYIKNVEPNNDKTNGVQAIKINTGLQQETWVIHKSLFC